jgi:hypothetical protein
MARFLCTTVTMATACILAGTAGAQTVAITNAAPGAGHLTANVDAYGSYGNMNAAYLDSFEPTGSTRNGPTFSAGFMLFSGTNRVAWTSMPELLATYPTPTWTTAVTTPVANSGANTATSAFDVRTVAGGPILSVNLTQTVSAAVAGVAALTQRYQITNTSGAAQSLIFTRNWDMDLVWDSNFLGDHVSSNNVPNWVTAHEPGSTVQAVTIGSAGGGIAHSFYYAGKQGHTPSGGGPAMGFGTDVQIWNNFGLPTTWQNYIPNVGYNTNGDSGFVNTDAFMGLEWRVSLGIGASTTIAVDSVYGSMVPEPATMAVLGLGALALIRRRRAK